MRRVASLRLMRSTSRRNSVRLEYPCSAADEFELCGVVAAHAGFEVVEGVHQFGVVLLPDFPPHLSDSTIPAWKGNGAGRK
jgi:hypothetical protein